MTDLPKNSFKKILEYLGRIITVLAIVFVFFKMYEYSDGVDLSRIDRTRYWYFLPLIILYFIGNTLLSMSWRNIVFSLGCNISYLDSFTIYGISQIAKYMPGNVFHFASRQIEGEQLRINRKVLIKSTFLELFLLVLSGATFGLFLLPSYLEVLSTLHVAMLFIVIASVSLLVLKRHFNTRLYFSIFLYMLFLLQSGFIFVTVLLLVDSSVSVDIDTVVLFISSFVIAWLIGLVTPGAPAGVGIRELVLITILGSIIADSTLVFSVLLARVITVLGDFAFFLVAWFLSNKR